MHKDSIHRVPDDCLILGAHRQMFRYNDIDFHVEVKSRPMTRTSNDYAKSMVALNMEANIRKSAAGLGHGQYLSTAQLASLQNGQIVLQTSMNGRSYSVPIEVSPQGEYSCGFLRSKNHSLRDVCAKVMDGLFEQNGIDNMYRSSPGMRNAIADRVAAQPAQYAYGMRM